jgi:hypothetical protein
MGSRMKWLQIDSSGFVVNIVIWDGLSLYEPQGVTQLLRCEDHPGVTFGWQLVDGNWIAPIQLDEDATE